MQKFNNLPADLRQKISGGEMMERIEALENKYNIPLAALIMKIMVREIALNDLTDYLFKENLLKEQAVKLAEELKKNIFSSLGSYFSAGAVKSVRPITPDMPPYAPVPPAGELKVKGASFFFSPDDEEEIRKLTKKIITTENFNLASGAIDAKLKEIISRAQINFGSASLTYRFSQILKTYLRGIRNKLETKTALMKPFLNGGLSFDEDSAEKVMLLSHKVLNLTPGHSLKPLPKINIPEPEKSEFFQKREIARDAAYDFSKLEKKEDKIKNDLKKLDTGHELAPLNPAVIPAEAARKSSPKDQKKITTAPKNIQTKAKPIEPALKSGRDDMFLAKRRFEAENLSQSQKTRIEDVKYVPRVMGPLEEIRYMDLINFRRLDRDPQKSANKVKSKISLLEEEGYDKKLEGIKLWRINPINKLYLEIGRSSIGENKPVDVIIEERKINNQEYLTAEEFKAIMDLNKSLRF
ncbi:hypothetical protein HY797_04345 [Candidatus Falkowbacteria bacterium]|nr:hypothetical protein [Candidatus Falkowbacteria bacterium]